MDSQEYERLLQLARGGDRAALGQLLEGFRPYLQLLARRRVDPRLSSRVDASDLVQITFLEAQRDLDAFRGGSFSELAAWLRSVLQRNVLRAAERHLDAQRRSVRREQKLEGSDGQPLAQLPQDESSPSRRAMRGEDAVRLAAALAQIPEDQAEAIRLRHLEGYSLKDMAAALQRSETAVAGLVKRGLQNLRKSLE